VYLFLFCPYGPSSLISALRGILVFKWEAWRIRMGGQQREVLLAQGTDMRALSLPAASPLLSLFLPLSLLQEMI